jgi:hypothetical protein
MFDQGTNHAFDFSLKNPGLDALKAPSVSKATCSEKRRSEMLKKFDEEQASNSIKSDIQDNEQLSESTVSQHSQFIMTRHHEQHHAREDDRFIDREMKNIQRKPGKMLKGLMGSKGGSRTNSSYFKKKDYRSRIMSGGTQDSDYEHVYGSVKKSEKETKETHNSLDIHGGRGLDDSTIIINQDRSYHFIFLKWRQYDNYTALFAMIGLLLAMVNFEIDVNQEYKNFIQMNEVQV